MYSALKYQGKSCTSTRVRVLRSRVNPDRLPCTNCCLFATKVMNWSWKSIAPKARTFARLLTIWAKLGCGAHVTYLRRLTVSKYPVDRMVTLEHLHSPVEQAEQQNIPAAELLDPLLMPMDSPASDYPIVNLPLTSSVYFKMVIRYVRRACRWKGWFA